MSTPSRGGWVRRTRRRQETRCRAMTPDDNKAAVRRFFDEVINAGHLERADNFVTPDYLEHQPLPGTEGRRGIEVAKAFSP